MSRILLMAGTRKGAFFLESDEHRREWTVHGPVLKGWEVSDLLLDERGASPRLFAAIGHFVYGPAIHRADDAGEPLGLGGSGALDVDRLDDEGFGFEQVAESPAYPESTEREIEQVWTLAPGRADDPDELYAGVAEAGLFVSRDGGDHWAEVEGLSNHETRANWQPGKGGLCCHSVLVDPTDPERIWVGISAVGVLRTEDGGETWTVQNDGLDVVVPNDDGNGDGDGPAIGSCVHALRHHPDDPATLYQQNHMGVFRSTDAADSWERIEDGLPSTFGFPLVVHPDRPETVYTVPLESDEHRMAEGGKPGVYRSRDGGDAWERLDDGLPTEAWVTVLRQAMTTDSLDPAGIYAGTTGGGIYHSADAGDSWQAIDCELPRIFSLRTVVLD